MKLTEGEIHYANKKTSPQSSVIPVILVIHADRNDRECKQVACVDSIYSYILYIYNYIRGRGFRAVSSEGMKFMTEMTGMTEYYTPLFPYFPHPSNMFFPHNFRHKNCTRRQFQKCAKMTFQTRKCIIQTPKCIFQRKSLPFHLPMCYTYPIKSKERRNLILWIFFPRSSWTTRLP